MRRCLLVALLLAAGLPPLVRAARTASGPELPRRSVDTTYVPPTGATVVVAAGGDLQGALDRAHPGDLISLEAGASFAGPFVLPNKPGDAWITIRSSAPDSSLPPPGTRVGPSDTGAMPKLEAASDPVVAAAPGAHHYRFIGIEVRPRPGSFLVNLVTLGTSESSLQDIPHHVIFDRCYLHGDPKKGTRRGIALNAADSAVIDSYLADFKEAGGDSQAIAGWNGPGPFKIENDHLEGAAENLLFGGADPEVRGLVPADIEIRRNHLVKPLAWKAGEAGYEGTEWSVKNLFELKNAQRVLVEGNVLENNWVQSQNGFAVLFTPRNQDGSAPWSVVEDVTFVNNIVRHTGSAVNVLGHDDISSSARTQRIAIRNTLFDDVGSERWGGGGTLLQILEGTADVAVEHVTALHTGNIIMAEGAPHGGFVFRDTIAEQNRYGIVGAGTAPGRSSLGTYFPGAVVRKNVIVGGGSGDLPPENFTPASLDEVGFADLRAGNYRLKSDSPYRRAASDGSDVGVDFDALAAAMGPTAPDAEPPIDHPRQPPITQAPGPFPQAAALVFWGATALLGYALVGYPLVIRIWATLRPRGHRRSTITPDVTVLIVARDEAGRIESRLGNVLSLDYPRDRLEVVFASDGSSDGTPERARSYERAGVRVVAFGEPRGKPSVLNDLVPQCRGEVVVLADARQRFEPAALRALVAPFADPRVGAVSGELLLDEGRGAVGEGVGFYWRYEKAIRAAEGRVDSTVGATGAIYALRRDLYEPIPPDTILDDILIPIGVVRRGYRVVFEAAARAHDRAASSAREEFARKVRTIAGNFQLFWRESWLLSPFHNRLWVQTLSHKGLRLLMPVLLLAAFVSCLDLAAQIPYRLALAGQGAFYASALIAHALGHGRRAPRLLAVPYVVCLLAWATIVAFFRFAAGRQPVTWQRAPAVST